MHVSFLVATACNRVVHFSGKWPLVALTPLCLPVQDVIHTLMEPLSMTHATLSVQEGLPGDDSACYPDPEP